MLPVVFPAMTGLKPLSSWMPDLGDRIEQLNTWGFVGRQPGVGRSFWTQLAEEVLLNIRSNHLFLGGGAGAQ